MEPMTVQWVIVAAVDDEGYIYLIDHDFVTDVQARRPATLDDIYAAAAECVKHEDLQTYSDVREDTYTVAFLVFQTTDGHIAASPNIFDNFVPLTGPTVHNLLGAFSVLQGQIIAQKTVDLIQMNAAMARVQNKAADPDAAKKSSGGLYVA
jgi:hypothetical protein